MRRRSSASRRGTLDERDGLRPVGHIWVEFAQPWVRETLTGLTYERAPPTFDDLFAAWRNQGS